MIKFHRHIRQKLLEENRFSKYLFYAMGEIILVVIGILIALQINNWNDGRRGQKLKKSYGKSLINELKTDLSQLDRLDRLYLEKKVGIQDYFQFFNTKNPNIDSLKLRLAQLNTSKSTFNSSAYTIEDLITTGNLTLFESEEKEALLKLKNTQEKNEYYERITINNLLDVEKTFYENADLAFDLGLSKKEHVEVKNWRNDVNSPLYRVIHNNLASTVNLYNSQIEFNQRIRQATQDLLKLLEKDEDQTNRLK
ncbi:MAG: DUF6090 family protein [Bacteroidota bacterium]